MVNNFSKENKGKLVFFGFVVIVLLGVIIYSNILHAPFVFDDYSAVVDNEKIKSLKTSLRDISNNRYLTSFSFALNYAGSGIKPFSYHLINNIIHIINAILVYYLVILTFRTPHMINSKLSAQFIAFSSAFVFIAHPIQTQAVTYVAQRSTSMATLFYLLSLVTYIKARLSQTTEVEVKAKVKFFSASTLTFYFLSLFSAILAMKTKEIAFTVPIIIVLYEFSFFSKTLDAKCRMSNLKRFLFLVPILLTILIIPLSMLDITKPVETIAENIDIQSRETANISRTDYLLTQFRVIMTYLRLLILPVNQSVDYTYPVYHSLLNPQVFLSFLFLTAVFCSGIYLLYHSRFTVHSSRFIAFGIFWFFITLSVEASVIPIKDVIFEHRLYLPSIGFFIASISSIEYLFRQTKVKITLIIVFVVFLSIGTYNRNTIWKDPQTLWEDVLTKFPNNIRAYNGLGVIFKNQDEYDKAIEQFEKALKINHYYTPAYYNLGDIQYRLGNYENAIAYFKKALKLKLSYHLHLDILTSLAITYSEMGDDENAVNTFKEAVRLYPSVISPYNNLGRQYIKMGKADLAIEILEQALKIRESPHIYYNLSVAYNLKGDKEKGQYMHQKSLMLLK